MRPKLPSLPSLPTLGTIPNSSEAVWESRRRNRVALFDRGQLFCPSMAATQAEVELSGLDGYLEKAYLATGGKKRAQGVAKQWLGGKLRQIRSDQIRSNEEVMGQQHVDVVLCLSVCLSVWSACLQP